MGKVWQLIPEIPSCGHCRHSQQVGVLFCYQNEQYPEPCKDARAGDCGMVGRFFEREPGADDE